MGPTERLPRNGRLVRVEPVRVRVALDLERGVTLILSD
jgi:hypothetical protein